MSAFNPLTAKIITAVMMTPAEKRNDIAKLMLKQLAAGILILPTAGMSFSWNILSLKAYLDKHHPDMKYPFED